MKIRVDDKVYRACQLRQCVEAISKKAKRSIIMYHLDYWHLSIGLNWKGIGETPWQALCRAVLDNEKSLEDYNIRTEPGR